MTSLIEQAAQRLEQLRQTGIEVPVAAAAPAGDAAEARRPQVSATNTASRYVELDLPALNAAGIVTPNAPRTRTADQFRVIKRPLLSNATGKLSSTLRHANLIMVTSALAGEGKSFTSVNLAMSIAAELDHTVMLVDADVARPSIPGMLGVPQGPGLLDVLKDSAELQSVLIRTNVDKLTILPSGNPHPRATELLASEAMRQLLDEMATRYPDRIVVFDSPPLLLTTESRVLASRMGQIVMVVQAERTLQSDVMHALSTIESCPVRLMVLNKARTDTRSGYGYGYGYGYGASGYGYGNENDAQRQPQSA